MINRERRNNYGLNTNVEIAPSATSQSNPQISNSIVINSDIPKENTNNSDIKISNIENPYPDIESLKTPIKSTRFPSTFNIVNRDVSISNDQNENTNIVESLESKLLEIYTDILLSNNKKLLANITSKQTIILSKNDLESIIKLITNNTCKVSLVPDESSCVIKVSPIKPIDSIKIIDGKNHYDFQTIYNATYNELVNKYKLNLSFCLD